MKEILFAGQLSLAEQPWLADHVVQGRVFVPMTAYIDMALTAGNELLGTKSLTIADVLLREPLVITADQSVTVQLVLEPTDTEGTWEFRIISLQPLEANGWLLHATGCVRRLLNGAATTQQAFAGSRQSLDAAAHYRVFDAQGINFGPSFRGVRQRGSCRRPRDWQHPPARSPSAERSRQCVPSRNARRLLAAADARLGTAADARHVHFPSPSNRLTFGDRRPATMTSHCEARGRDERPCRHADRRRHACRLVGQRHRHYSRLDRPSTGESRAKRCGRRSAVRSRLAADAIAGRNFGGSHAAANDARGGSPRPAKSLGLFGSNRGIGFQCGGKSPRCVEPGVYRRRPGNARLECKPGDTIGRDSIAKQLSVVPRHERLLHRIFDILAEAGYIEPTRAGWRVLRPLSEIDRSATSAQANDATLAFKGELTLLATCGGRLADVLRGVCDPLELCSDPRARKRWNTSIPIRPRRSPSIAWPRTCSRRWPRTCRKTARCVCWKSAPAPAEQRPTYSRHLPADRTAYCYTDISPALLGRARARFADYAFIEFDVLDIERDLAGQGCAERRFDVILASNVLHATADLSATLKSVRQLLEPDGLLVLAEGTRPLNWIDLTFGLTEGLVAIH